eukprot:1771725-Pleurochrysis_carterae.AAC.2
MGAKTNSTGRVRLDTWLCACRYRIKVKVSKHVVVQDTFAGRQRMSFMNIRKVPACLKWPWLRSLNSRPRGHSKRAL